MKMKGAQIVIEVLAEHGVDQVFGYPGGAVLGIYDELYKASDRIHHCITSHEQGASHAADGYARATGKTGVVIATSGPGATNLVTGIATAFLDSTPMVAITGNVACPLIGRDSFQEVDIAGITLSVTKHNYIVKDIERLADILREAFEIARAGRPGPVLVDIPKDIQAAECEFEPHPPAHPRPRMRAQSLDEALTLIGNAKRPFIYAGGGVVISEATENLLEFARRIDAPIGASMMGLSGVPCDDPRFLGMTGMHGKFAASKVMSMSDLIIAVGTRFSDRATGNKFEFSRDRKFLHIDIDPAEIGKNIAVTHSLVGDVRTVLGQLCAALAPQRRDEWRAAVEEMNACEDNHLEMARDRLTPQVIIEAVRERAPVETAVATDVGQHQMWTAQYYKFQKPRTFITSGGLGTMGFGMGAAIGACIGRGRARTVLFTGDGSFHMNLNELATAVRNELPLVIVIMNNGTLGMVRQWQTLFYGERYASSTMWQGTDFVKLAEAFGATGERVTALSELGSAIDRAFAHNGPVLLDVHVDIDEKVLPMIPPGGSIHDIILKG